MPGGRLYLGVDVGTSGIRALAVREDGRILVQERVPLDIPAPRQAIREQAPRVWLDALRTCLQALSRALGPLRRDVRALAIDGTSATLILCDEQLQPLRPGILYNDMRATEEALEIGRLFPDNGALAGASASLAKLVWLARHEDLRALRHIHHQSDWLTAQLTRQAGHSDPANVLKLGFDLGRMHWPPALKTFLTEQGLSPAALPQILPSGQTLALLDPDWADTLGLPRQTRLASGTTDSMAALIASGIHRPGQAVTSLGSTLVLKLAARAPVNAPASGIYSHRLHELWLPGGASNSGGQALRRYFPVDVLAHLSQNLQTDHPTGYHDYPLAGNGERFPLNRSDFSGCVQSVAQVPALHLQALLEGLSYIEAWGYQQLECLSGEPLQEVVTLGGGSGNAAWMQIRANVLDRPVLVPLNPEAALGAAMLAASEDFGSLESAQEALCQPFTKIFPSSASILFRKEYATFAARYASAYP